MRSFAALMFLLIADYIVYALFIRPVMNEVLAVLWAAAAMMNTIR